MLAQTLAITVALGSFIFYIAAFFFPEVHRKNDFIWSGVGLFYALVLWVCAGRITGGVLLGQTASVTLLVWLGWQTLSLRRAKTPSDQQTPITPEVEGQVKGFPGSLVDKVTGFFRKSGPPQDAGEAKLDTPSQSSPSEGEETTPETKPVEETPSATEELETDATVTEIPQTVEDSVTIENQTIFSSPEEEEEKEEKLSDYLPNTVDPLRPDDEPIENVPGPEVISALEELDYWSDSEDDNTDTFVDLSTQKKSD